MPANADTLLQAIARRRGLDIEMLRARALNRQARSRGWLGPAAAARSLALSYALEHAGQQLTALLAAGSRHVSGLALDDALRAVHAEAARGHGATLGYWPPPGQAPAELAQHYLAAVEVVGRAGLDVAVALKVDLMDYRADLLDPVLRAAAEHGVRLHFDAQGLETADRTHALVEHGLGRGVAVSGTLPARWRRAGADAERFIAWGLPVRLVKGQGGDPAWPRADPRRSFLALAEQLAGRAVHVGVATHDRRAAEPALRFLQGAGTPCALEQMRSLPRLDALAGALGVPVRAYVAYGRFGLPYAVGEVFRRPAIAGWILRDLLVRHRPAGPVAARPR
jgi:proline dehydrogenase